MVNKMGKLKRENRSHIKRLLHELNVEFDILRSDSNLFYIIKYVPKEFINHINYIEILLSYSFNEKILVAICPNIYILKKGDSTINIFYALNNTNIKLISGHVILNKNHVEYRYQESFNSIESISKEKLSKILNEIVAASIYTCEEIRKLNNYEEK